MTQTEAERILKYWEYHPCFVCSFRGFCDHREIEVAEAELEAQDRRDEAWRQARAKVPMRRRTA
jgi:hypothetical protein